MSRSRHLAIPNFACSKGEPGEAMGGQVPMSGSEGRAGPWFIGLRAVRHAQVKVCVSQEGGVFRCRIENVAQVHHAGGRVVAVTVGRHDEETAEGEMRGSVRGVEFKGVFQGVPSRGEKVAFFKHTGGVGGAAHQMVGEADPGRGFLRQAFGGPASRRDGAARVAAFGKFLCRGLERLSGGKPLAGRGYPGTIGARNRRRLVLLPTGFVGFLPHQAAVHAQNGVSGCTPIRQESP